SAAISRPRAFIVRHADVERTRRNSDACEPFTDTDIYIVVPFFKAYAGDIRNAAPEYKGIRTAYFGYRYFPIFIDDRFAITTERYGAFVCSYKQVPFRRICVFVA